MKHTFVVALMVTLAACGGGPATDSGTQAATEVIDYTRSDYSKSAEPFDVIFDTVTTKGVRANRRVLTDDGIWVQAGMKKKASSLRLVLGLVKLKIVNLWSSKKMVSFLARITKDDLETMNDYLESGDVDPVIHRTFPLEEASQALRHQGEGHARGKSVITP